MRRNDVKEEVEEGFPIKVTYHDYNTGLIKKQDPYILRVVGDNGGSKSEYMERPKGSGNLFDRKGRPIGRWDASKSEGERYLANAPHIAWERPETEDEMLANSVIAANVKIKELEQELLSIKAERERSIAPKKKDSGA